MIVPRWCRVGLACLLGGSAIGLAPAWAAVSVVGSLDRHFVVEPGGVVRGEIIVENPDNAPVVVTTALRDYRQSRSRDHWPPAPAHARSLAPFVRFEPAEQTIPAKTRARVAFVIDLPEPSATRELPPLAGTYWTALMVQPEPILSGRQAGPDNALSIKERFQTAVRLSATLATPAKTALKFASAQWRHAEATSGSDAGTGTLELELHNTGQRLLDLTLVGEWVLTQATAVERTPLGRVQIYPGGRRRVAWRVRRPASSLQEALVIATPTERMLSQRRFGARFVVDSEAGVNP